MGPHFLAAFGCDRSDFVLTGVMALLTFVFLPVYGRLTDLLGVRRIAIIGVVGLPACWLWPSPYRDRRYSARSAPRRWTP